MLLLHDSGIGGLSIAGAMRQALPNEPMAYLADYGGFPYGRLSDEALTDRLLDLLRRAIAAVQPDVLVIACNTASTIALPALRAGLDVPVVGCVPPIKPAAALSQTRRVGLLATEATVRRPYVSDLTARFAAGCTVFSHGSANLAILAEAAFRDQPVDAALLRTELDLLLRQDGADMVDVVALGCTHYAFLLPQLKLLAPQIRHWVDPAEPVARQTAAVMAQVTHRTPSHDGWRDVALVTAAPPPGTESGLRRYGFTDIRMFSIAG